MKKKIPKLMSAILAILMVLSAIPMTAFAAPASDLPANMTDHSILRALEYTGYDVQKQKNDGTLYQPNSFGSKAPASVLSNIHYGTSCSGRETVADSSTVTGKAPNIAKFEQSGLCCAGFVSYYICNYLPNIEGADTQFITDAVLATGMNSQAVVTWQTALNKLVSEGKIEKVGTSSSNVNHSKLTPGDLIIFGTSSNSHTHIAVYSGTYKGVDYIIHVGNDRGPEIMRVDWMSQAGDKSSYPNAYYHLPQEIFESDGEIEVYKKDTDGNKLSGAVFVATNTETGKSYKIGPTNSNGYIIARAEDASKIQRMQTVVQEINTEYDNKLTEIKNNTTYDVLEMSGGRAVWKEVLSVYSVKLNTDPNNPQEVATMDDSKKQVLRDIFWEMNSVSSRTETKTETEITETDDGHGNIMQTETTVTKTYLYITVAHKTVDEMALQYGFNQEQKDYLTELLQPENNSLWSDVLYGITASDGQTVNVAFAQINNIGGEPY